ncbi:MAG: hypothetical protein DMG06_23905, partial [Acidobacteria bacterium]
MGRTIRARWREGRLEPLERIELPDGKEVTVTIAEVSPSRNLKAFRGAAGGWKGTLNAPALIRRIYANRLISTRVIAGSRTATVAFGLWPQQPPNDSGTGLPSSKLGSFREARVWRILANPRSGIAFRLTQEGADLDGAQRAPPL